MLCVESAALSKRTARRFSTELFDVPDDGSAGEL
jgi:hypothetical protein